MSKNDKIWLVIGLCVGAFATFCWMNHRQTALALADHDNRISTLECKSDQRAIADRTPKDKMKWFFGWVSLASAVLKLILMFGHHKF